nr:hypothetical protein [Tanacetum cinerariifolium]
EINKDHEEINKDIDWDAAIDHVKQKYKENPQYIKRYQVMKKRPQTERMSYDEIRLIFQARFDANMRFLFKSREEMEEEDQEVLKSINETPAQKAAKRRKLNEEAQEVKDLKKHLEVVNDEDDDVFIEATQLARKLLELMLSKRSRKNTKCVNAADEEHTTAKHKLMLLSNINAARLKLKLFKNIAATDMNAVKTVELKVESVDVKNEGVYSTVETKPVKKNNFSPPTLRIRFLMMNIRFVPQEILTKSGKLKTAGTPVNIVRLVNTADSKPIMNYSRPISNDFKRGDSQAIRPFNKYSAYKKNIFNTEGHLQQKKYKEKGVIDSGYSRHMIRNKCYLTDYEDYNGGFVSFGDGKGRIYGKGKIKTGTLDFDELLDESQVLLRVPRKDNIYSVDLKSVAPTGEAVRTMLVDSKLPTTFWAKTVSTACYVLNRVLVIKPHKKTPYELIHGRPPLIDFMKPFGCPVTILNTKDYLGMFDEKADEGFFVGYSVVSKAMRVFNKRIRIVEETLNIRFLENAPNLKGNEPDLLFDIDSLTISMNYVSVVVGFQTNGIVGTKDNIVAGQDEKKKEHKQDYILIPICTTDPLISQGLKDNAVDAGKKVTEVDKSQVLDNGGQDDQVTRTGPSFVNAASPSPINAARTLLVLMHLRNILLNDFLLLKMHFIFYMVEMNNVVSSYIIPNPPLTKFFKDHLKDQVISSIETPVQTRQMTKINEEHGLISSVQKLKRTSHKDFQNCLFACYLSQMEPKKPVQALKDPSWVEAMHNELLQFKLLNIWNKKDERGIVIKNKARLVAQGHTQVEGINYDEVFAPVARIEAIRLFLAYASFKDFVVYQMDVKSAFLYGKIEEEVYVCQPPGFEDPNFPDKVYKVEKALYGLHQAPRACVKTASTLMEPNKALIKDVEAKDVDVHLYILMIGSLMYLTASRPDITFVVCACASLNWAFGILEIHHFTWKPIMIEIILELALIENAQQKMRLSIRSGKTEWKRLTFSFEAEQDNGNINRTQSMATLNEPLPQGTGSGFEQLIDFLNAKPVRYALTMNPTVYASCVKQFWTTTKVKKVNGQEKIQALVDKLKVIITKESIRRDIKFNDAEGTECLPNDTIFKELARMGAKTTTWNEFSSTMASAIICLANNQKFNFSKYIFDNMVKHLEGGVNFIMFLRFLQVFVDKQVEGMPKHKEIYVISSHTKKIFANMRRQGHGFSGIVTPLFKTMMVLDLKEAKTAQAKDIANLKKRDKKLEYKRKSRPAGLRRLKKERSIEDIDPDAEIALVDEARGRIHDTNMFGIDDLEGNEVIVDVREKIIEKEVSTADPVTTAGEVLTAASVEDSAAPTTTTTADVDDGLTLVKTLIAIKAAKPKVKGKAKMIELAKPLKNKDQITLDEELARKLETKMKAKIEEEERIGRKKDEANRAEKVLCYQKSLRDQEQATHKGIAEKAEKMLEIVTEDDDDVAIEATPLSSKSPTIVDYKIYRERKKSYFKIIKADGNSQNYLTFGTMFKNFNREDLEVLRSIVKERFRKTKIVDDMDNLLFQTLKTMFEPHVEDIIWKYQQGAVKVNN